MFGWLGQVLIVMERMPVMRIDDLELMKREVGGCDLLAFCFALCLCDAM